MANQREPRVIIKKECPVCHTEVKGTLFACACSTGDAARPLVPTEVRYVEVVVDR